jgi:hypothetical protein
MAGPRAGTVGSANRLRPPHVDWQQLHGTSTLGPRVAACSVALPRSNVRALRSKKSHKRYPVSVGSTPCAMSDYSGEQLHARLFTSLFAKWDPFLQYPRYGYLNVYRPEPTSTIRSVPS